MPFTEPYINTGGVYGICCIEQESPTNKIYTIKDSFENHWNSDQMKTARKSMLNGVLPTACSVCARQELVGKQSMRQRKNLRYFGKENVDADNVEVQKLIEHTKDGYLADALPKKGLLFSTGRVCQLGCISCSSSYSTFLEQEYKKLGYDPKYKDKKNPFDTDYFIPQSEFDETLYDTLKSQIADKEYLQVTGGEPFISKKFYEFLEWLVHEGYAKNIILLITTNGMHLNKEKIKILKEFKWSIIMFSVDGYKDVDDYLRYPSRWEEKMQNFDLLKSVANEIVFVSTVYSLNVFSIDRLIKYAQDKKVNIHLNTLEEPDFLHMKNIPDSLKQTIYNKLSKLAGTASIIASLQQVQDKEAWNQTLQVVKDFDRIRNLSFKKIEQNLENLY